ncbi:DUF4350 domain-containing protein [Bizionia argentinensis JUB59]|uniref:DUF4350 domain-containing protein n=1 Tax=Bizionia argentinensis JUB59 TaxID=1046627 RepID=G2EBC6_9FLAO|nr:DUF4350 domain-containing protein [Bizionia argentinensis]EGV44258.1 DUF4350 domain-containing protein [Bizionia argentinensis JUB59]
MDKRSKMALYGIAAIIVLLMIAEVAKPKAINWRNSYSAADKIPLGCYVIFNELKTFSSNPLETSDKSIYEVLNNSSDFSNTTLILINDYIGLEKESSEALLKFVENGNTVFISTAMAFGKFADTLNIKMKSDNDGFLKQPSKSIFASKSLGSNGQVFDDVIENSYITSIDTTNALVLGYLENEEKTLEEINFIKTPFGENGGAFYIHANPFAFSNYHMLNDKADYAATVLSFLPKNNSLLWDNYYKSGRKVIKSPLRFILANSALKWTFYISLLGLIIFVIFKGKRTQRIIPVVEPLKNATVEFTQTIGDLYYQHGDYSNIINKKITYFLEFVRSTYYLETNEFSERFIQKLAVKSANNVQDTKSLIDLITFLKSKNNHTENELIALNKQIEHFTKNNL